MKFHLTFDIDNVVFDGFCDGQKDGVAIGRVLREVADRMPLQLSPQLAGGLIRDENGNTIGDWEIADED